jgi:hypothetical protein
MPDVFIGDAQMRQQLPRQLIEFPYLLATMCFAPDFVMTEIPGVALQYRDFMQTLRVLQKAVQSLFRCRVNMLVHDAFKAALLICQCPTDDVLHGTVARSNHALFRQVPHQVPEDIDGLAAYRRRLPGMGFQFPPCHCIGVSVFAETKDQPLLFQARAFSDLQIGVTKTRKVFLPYVCGVFGYVLEVDGEKHVSGLEIGELQDKEQF